MGLATYISVGDQINYTPAAAVAEGAVVVLGDHIGIATMPIAANALGSLAVEGVFELPKQGTGGNDFSDGEALYWDAANSRVDDTFVAGLPRIGVCVGGATATATTCRVRLTPSVATAPALGAAPGYRVARGVTALDASNPTPVATGLTTIVSFVCSLAGTAAPGVGTSVLTVGAFTDGSAAVYAWKPTSASDCTLVASTGTENINWVAVGT